MTNVAQIRQMQEEMNTLRKELNEKMKSAFSDGAKSLFIEHPKLKSFGWTQYTPYFNDGDSCTFSARIDSGYINDSRVDDFEDENGKDTLHDMIYEYTNGGLKKVVNPDYDPELAAAADAVNEFLSLFDDEYFLQTFEDHKKITVSADGVQVNDHSHD